MKPGYGLSPKEVEAILYLDQRAKDFAARYGKFFRGAYAVEVAEALWPTHPAWTCEYNYRRAAGMAGHAGKVLRSLEDLILATEVYELGRETGSGRWRLTFGPADQVAARLRFDRLPEEEQALSALAGDVPPRFRVYTDIQTRTSGNRTIHVKRRSIKVEG